MPDVSSALLSATLYGQNFPAAKPAARSVRHLTLVVELASYARPRFDEPPSNWESVGEVIGQAVSDPGYTVKPRTVV